MKIAYSYVAVFLAGMLAMYALMSGSSTSTLPPALVSVQTHTVYVPLAAQDKNALEDAGAISKKTKKDPDKEVLGTGVLKGDSGTRNVAAVLHTPSGITSLEVERSWMEWMGRHELGVGLGLHDGDVARAAEYRLTFARLWSFYAIAEARVYDVDRQNDRHPWTAMVWATARF